MSSRVVVDCIFRFTGGGDTLCSALLLIFVLMLEPRESWNTLRLTIGLVSTRAALCDRLTSIKVHESRE